MVRVPQLADTRLPVALLDLAQQLVDLVADVADAELAPGRPAFWICATWRATTIRWCQRSAYGTWSHTEAMPAEAGARALRCVFDVRLPPARDSVFIVFSVFRANAAG